MNIIRFNSKYFNCPVLKRILRSPKKNYSTIRLRVSTINGKEFIYKQLINSIGENTKFIF